jgi:hypothetical protein
LTGRAGLSLFVAYLHGIEIFDWLDHWFASIRKNRKGVAIAELFKQAVCFFIFEKDKGIPTPADELGALHYKFWIPVANLET